MVKLPQLLLATVIGTSPSGQGKMSINVAVAGEGNSEEFARNRLLHASRQLRVVLLSYLKAVLLQSGHHLYRATTGWNGGTVELM